MSNKAHKTNAHPLRSGAVERDGQRGSSASWLIGGGMVLVGVMGAGIFISIPEDARETRGKTARMEQGARSAGLGRDVRSADQQTERLAQPAELPLAAAVPPAERGKAEEQSADQPPTEGATVANPDPAADRSTASNFGSDPVAVRQRLRGVSLQLKNRQDSQAVIEQALESDTLTEDQRVALEARQERISAKLAGYRQQVNDLQTHIQTLEEGQ